MGLENEIKGFVYKGLEIICCLHYKEGSACGTSVLVKSFGENMWLLVPCVPQTFSVEDVHVCFIEELSLIGERISDSWKFLIKKIELVNLPSEIHIFTLNVGTVCYH